MTPFPTVFSTGLENFLLFSSNLKLSSADCFNLDQFKICRLVMGQVAVPRGWVMSCLLEYCFHSLTFTTGQNFRLVKLKELADDKRNMTHNLKFGLKSRENIVGKGENAGNQHFLPFLQCFLPFPKRICF